MTVFIVLGVTGTPFTVIFEVLRMLCGALGDLWISGRLFSDLGCHFGGLWTPSLCGNRSLDYDFSMHACKVVPGSIFIGFMVGQGIVEHEKPCKFIVLSSNFKV